METVKKRLKIQWLIYLLVFAVFLYIGYKVPYCHDEWRWGLDERVELMKNGFRNYNGRYLGNLLALLITRSVMAKALVIAGGVVWLLHVMYRNICFREAKRAKENLFLLLSCVFLLLSLPATLFQQSYGWSAAFVNFVPPVFLFLIYYNWTEWIYDGYQDQPLWKTILVIPLGISVQLFSENVTLFVALYAVWVAVYTLIRYRKISAMQINFIWSSFLGVYLMFANGAYARAAESSGYKKNIDHCRWNDGTVYQQYLVSFVYQQLGFECDPVSNSYISDHKNGKKEFPDNRDGGSILRIQCVQYFPQGISAMGF